MEKIERIRNFCIIAHIDHGKSTLADRLIESTGTISKREMTDRVLDTLELEKERGITIKLQTARLIHEKDGEEYFLNLIDTPGHVDFSHEVSRSVAASEGALLLVDATQGIQAQTLSTVYKAMEYDLSIIPVLNKVDMPSADKERVKQDIVETFGFQKDSIIEASGKTGVGVQEILDTIIKEIPHPDKENNIIFLPTIESNDDLDKNSTKALIFDSFYHEYMGVVSLVKIVSGSIPNKTNLYTVGTKKKIEPVEIGFMVPSMLKSQNLKEGEVGYIATGLKDISEIHTGDTITLWNDNKNHEKVTPLLGYLPSKPMVYASLFPVEASDYPEFAEALEKLALNDASLTFEKEYSQALGTGFVCGFLGLLHLEITQDRLEREFNIDLISTVPTVEFKIKLSTKDYSKVPNINVAKINKETNIATIRTALEFPNGSLYEEVKEPWVKIEIITPEEFIGPIMELSQKSRGVYKTTKYISRSKRSGKHALLIYEIPTIEIITNFFDRLKSVSRGYASMDYEFLEYRKSNIVKVTLLLNGEEVEPLSYLSHVDKSRDRAKELVAKLKDIIPKQQYKVPIQAAIGGEIIARETIQALRKDVTAKLYGGDETRKKKLLEKQKKVRKNSSSLEI